MSYAAQLSSGARLRDLVVLTKPGIVLMTTMTAAWGLGLAPRSWPASRGVVVLIGTALCVAGANVFNMLIERGSDRLMDRTSARPLARDAMHPAFALAWGTALELLSLGILALAGPAPAALGAAGFVVYVFAYTPLKRVTPHALLVGCVAGSMPPLIGWSAATGSVNGAGLALGGMLFAWQIPHFLAISLFRKHDYARAGIRAAAVVWTERTIHSLIRSSSVVLILASLALLPTSLAGAAYATVALAAGAWFFALTLRRRDDNTVWARGVFRASLVYLPAVAIGMIADGLMR